MGVGPASWLACALSIAAPTVASRREAAALKCVPSAGGAAFSSSNSAKPQTHTVGSMQTQIRTARMENTDMRKHTV